jgi:hypothetical protein
MHILALLVMAPGELRAIQIAPNPNPVGSTITITPSASGENLVPFTNLGTINIEPFASFQNSKQFDNGNWIPFTSPVGGTVINSGTIINSDHFTSYGYVSLLEGSRFINLPSGVYFDFEGGLGISGTFLNEGRVEHATSDIIISETGQYIQRQSATSSVTPTTVTGSGTFWNAGRVHIAAGEFSNRFFGIYRQTGTTQIDGVFKSEGVVRNDGQFTVGKTGFYEHQNASPPGWHFGGVTYNNGTFTNAGTTNVNTGVFENNGDFRNNAGQVRIGEGALFGNNRDTPFSTPATAGVYIQEAGGRTRIDGGFDNRGSVSNEGTITVGTTGAYTQSSSSLGLAGTTRNAGVFQNEGRVNLSGPSFFFNTGQYAQLARGTTGIDGTFVNLSGHLSNAGAITVGTTGEYIQERLPGAGPGVPFGTTINSGTFTNAGTTNIATGVFINQGSVVNSGTFQVAALGQVEGNGSYVQNAVAAQTIVNGTFAHHISLQAGSFSGTGTIIGAVMNTGGVVQPGSSIVPGTLTLANYTQGIYGRLDLKIGGLFAGSQYDVLKVTGPGTFGGSLSVRLLNGFTPGLGNRFDLLACSLGCAGLNGGTLFGGGVSLPSLASGLAWLSGLTDGGNSFSLTVVAAAASAPEPGTLLLIGSGFVGLVMWRGRRAGSTHTSRP